MIHDVGATETLGMYSKFECGAENLGTDSKLNNICSSEDVLYCTSARYKKYQSNEYKKTSY